MSTYILQKGLPDLKAGAEFTKVDSDIKPTAYVHNTTSIPTTNGKTWKCFIYEPELVENNPEWFKLKEEKRTFKDWDEVIEGLTGIKNFMSNFYTIGDMRRCFNEARNSEGYPNFDSYIDSLNK